MTSVQALYRRAHETLDAARYNLDGGFVATAVNRAYYAAFHAASAALLSIGEAPKTHAGTIGRFNVHFVKSGRMAADIARVLPYDGDARKGADYDAATTFDTRAVADLIEDVARFVAAVGPLLAVPPDTDR